MAESIFTHWALIAIVYAAALFIFVIGTRVLIAVVVYVVDRSQTANAIRRNFPVVGRLRYLFARMSEDAAPAVVLTIGTGAIPLPLLDYTGMLIADSLPLTCDRLEAHGLRQRVKVIASGKLMMPGPVAWALAGGADFVQSARGFMYALGCIQAIQCNRNTCPTGVTTHDPRLQRGLDVPDKATRVAAYAKMSCARSASSRTAAASTIRANWRAGIAGSPPPTAGRAG